MYLYRPLLEERGVEAWAVDILGWGFTDRSGAVMANVQGFGWFNLGFRTMYIFVYSYDYIYICVCVCVFVCVCICVYAIFISIFTFMPILCVQGN